MLRRIYAIYDKVAEDISGPAITCRNEAEAVRLFTELLNRKDSTIGAHPKDHDLIWLGDIISKHTEGVQLDAARGESGQIVMSGETWAALQEVTA